MKAHVMMPDGSYEKVDRRGKQLLCAQDEFVREAKAAVADPKGVTHERVFRRETNKQYE